MGNEEIVLNSDKEHSFKEIRSLNIELALRRIQERREEYKGQLRNKDNRQAIDKMTENLKKLTVIQKEYNN